jgi:hypothetical protein
MSKTCGACSALLTIVLMGATIGVLSGAHWFGVEHGKHLKRMQIGDVVQDELLSCIRNSEDCGRLYKIREATWK